MISAVAPVAQLPRSAPRPARLTQVCQDLAQVIPGVSGRAASSAMFDQIWGIRNWTTKIYQKKANMTAASHRCPLEHLVCDLMVFIFLIVPTHYHSFPGDNITS